MFQPRIIYPRLNSKCFFERGSKVWNNLTPFVFTNQKIIISKKKFKKFLYFEDEKIVIGNTQRESKHKHKDCEVNKSLIGTMAPKTGNAVSDEICCFPLEKILENFTNFNNIC